MPQIIKVAGEQFEFYSKEEWGSITPSVPMDTDGQPEPKGYLHHEGGGIVPLMSVEQEKVKMRALQDYCINRAGQGWSDIPYNIVVFPSGRAYDGRGWRAQSGATASENTESKAVLMLGNFDKQPNYTSQLNTAALCFVWGVQNGEFAPNLQVLGHKENPDHPGATTCPGANTDMNKFRALVQHKMSWKPPVTEPEVPPVGTTSSLVRTNHPHYPVECIVELSGNTATRLEPGSFGDRFDVDPADVPFRDWKELAVIYTFVLSPL